MNFPQLGLMLDLSTSVTLEVGAVLDISIIRQQQEFTFPASVCSSQKNKLIVKIENSAQESYQAFGAAVFSRGPDWPKWLPGRNADHPLPPWTVKAFNSSRDALMGVAQRVGELARLVGFGSLIKIWKKK
jgi:hypothetical protein